MTDPAARIAAAEAQAAAARSALDGTIDELKVRLQPRRLASEVAGEAKAAGLDWAHKINRTVPRPAIAAVGIAVGALVAFGVLRRFRR